MENNIHLKWTRHQGTVLSEFNALLSTESLVDVTLACEGQYIRTHKMILSVCSPYFQELINVDVNKHPIFFLKDVKHTELKALIHYMYRGEVNIAQENLQSFLAVAQALKIRGLADVETDKNNYSNRTNVLPESGTKRVVITEPLVNPTNSPKFSNVSQTSIHSQEHDSASRQSPPSTSILVTTPTSGLPAAKKSRVDTRLSSQVQIKLTRIQDTVQSNPSTPTSSDTHQTIASRNAASDQYTSVGDPHSGYSQDDDPHGHIGIVEDLGFLEPALKLEATGAIKLDLEVVKTENPLSSSLFDTWQVDDGDNSGAADEDGEKIRGIWAGEGVVAEGDEGTRGEPRKSIAMCDTVMQTYYFSEGIVFEKGGAGDSKASPTGPTPMTPPGTQAAENPNAMETENDADGEVELGHAQNNEVQTSHVHAYKCRQGCDKTFKSMASRSNHHSIKHKGLRFVCQLCKNEFKSSNSGKHHLRTKHNSVDHKKDLSRVFFQQNSRNFR